MGDLSRFVPTGIDCPDCSHEVFVTPGWPFVQEFFCRCPACGFTKQEEDAELWLAFAEPDACGLTPA